MKKKVFIVLVLLFVFIPTCVLAVSSKTIKSEIPVNFILVMTFLIIFWFISYRIYAQLYRKYQQAVSSYAARIFQVYQLKAEKIGDLLYVALSCKRAIQFNMIVLIFLYIVKVRFLIILALVYFILITIVDVIQFIISTITELDNSLRTKEFDQSTWSVMLSKFLMELCNIITISTLFTFL